MPWRRRRRNSQPRRAGNRRNRHQAERGAVTVERERPTTLRLGDTEVARIGLGTNRLTNTPPNVAFVKAAVAAGVGMIDTAHMYTAGQSEETIGAALSPDPGRCVIATK